MKNIVLLFIAIMALGITANAGNKKKKKVGDSQMTQAAYNDSAEVHWMSISEVEAAMKKEPKKVWLDMYTSWCGWCKVMDRKTFSNPDVIRYMNANFYNVKMDAEMKEDVTFQGKVFHFSPENRAHELAIQIMGGRMSYPTSLVMEEGFAKISAFAGYQNVSQTEKILRYFAEGHNATKTWQEYEGSFIPKWQELAQEEQAAGH